MQKIESVLERTMKLTLIKKLESLTKIHNPHDILRKIGVMECRMEHEKGMSDKIMLGTEEYLDEKSSPANMKPKRIVSLWL